MHGLLKIWLSHHIVVNALKIGLAVGTMLNLVNQGENIMHGATIEWGHLLLNYLVPYLRMKRRSIQFFQRHTQPPCALNSPHEATACCGPVASRYSDLRRGR